MKISVIIPIYNVEQYIEQCLVSILEQSYDNLEVILVNDGTKDNSMRIIEKYLSDLMISNGKKYQLVNINLDDVDDDFECLVLIPQFGNIISGKITVRVVLRCAVGVGRIHFFCICFLFPKLGS